MSRSPVKIAYPVAEDMVDGGRGRLVPVLGQRFGQVRWWTGRRGGRPGSCANEAQELDSLRPSGGQCLDKVRAGDVKASSDGRRVRLIVEQIVSRYCHVVPLVDVSFSRTSELVTALLAAVKSEASAA